MSGRTNGGRRIRKVAILEPSGSTTKVFSGIRLPRQGAVLLGTILAQQGYEVDVFIEDLAAFDWKRILSADLVGISTITPTAPRSYALADVIRAQGIPVVMGGFHVTYLKDEALDHADFVVRGEGEDTLVDLVNALQDGGDFAQIRGLSFTDGCEKVHNEDRPLEGDLDRFPIPDYSLVHSMRPGGIVSIVTRRGCPFECSFCCVAPFGGNIVRETSVDRVLSEVEQQVAWNGKRGVLFFADDIFNLKPPRMKAILRGMIENDLTPLWVGQVRHEASRDGELLELMRRSGCARVFVGFESVNPRTLELFNKHESVGDVAESIRRFHDARIKVHGMFVVGSDVDDTETAQETVAFSQEHDLDSMQFNVLTPLPGSRDYDRMQERRDVLLPASWKYYDGNHVVHRPERMTPAELQMTASRGMKSFYSLRAIGQRLVRGDLLEVAARMHGFLLARRFDRESRGYAKWLETQSGAAGSAEYGHMSESNPLEPVGLMTRLRRWVGARCRINVTRFMHLPSTFAKSPSSQPVFSKVESLARRTESLSSRYVQAPVRAALARPTRAAARVVRRTRLRLRRDSA